MASHEQYNTLAINIAFELAKEKGQIDEEPQNLIIGVSSIIHILYALHCASKTTPDEYSDLEQVLGSLIREKQEGCDELDTILGIFHFENLGPLHSTFRNQLTNVDNIVMPVPNDLNQHDDMTRSLIVKELVDRINKAVQTQTQDKFKQLVLDADFEVFHYGRVFLVAQSQFVVQWQDLFDYETYEDDFMCSPTTKKKINMMSAIADTVLVSDLENELEATILSLPYKNGASYIVYQPNRIASYVDLLRVLQQLMTGNLLSRLLASFRSQPSSKQILPKYSLTSHYSLTNALKNVYEISALVGDGNFLPTLFESGPFACQHLSLDNITYIANTEKGTRTSCRTGMWCVDGVAEHKCHKINQPYIFLILSPGEHIVDVGIFMHGKNENPAIGAFLHENDEMLHDL